MPSQIRTLIGNPTRTIAAVLGFLIVAAAGNAAVSQDLDDVAASLTDPIVGVWTGTAAEPEKEGYQVRLTFVSPKGGIVRYPGETPCGGVLTGDRHGDEYEYQESITFNGLDERSDGCFDGVMRLSIDGDTMKLDWSGTYEGQERTATGELKRQGKRVR
jgi:hypothetical protein